MKGISIYMALIMLFGINFTSVGVGGDKDKQNPRPDTTQECCNNEREVQNREGTENVPNDEHGKGAKDLDIKHSTVAREQMAEKNSHVRKHKYNSDYYWLIDRYDSLNEDDLAYDYYSSDERDDEKSVDENSEYCNCCEIL